MSFKLPRKARFFWVYPLAAWLFLRAEISEASLYVGSVVIFLGEWLRLWADAYVGAQKVNWTKKWRNEAKIGRLVTAGPYAYVRNPLYVGTFLIGLGLCIVVRNGLLAVGCLIFFISVYRPKTHEEEMIISDEWGEAFERYCRAVPRWFPTLRPYPKALRHGQWRWEGIRASKEWKTLIWVTVCVLVLYFREEWGKGKSLLPPTSVKHLLLLGLGLVLIGIDLSYELVKRIRRCRR